MAHGGPDWGLMGPKTINYGLDDMAELAARLGSPVSFDRRGDVLFFDDFTEGVAAWDTTTPGPGATLVLECGYSVCAPYALIMSPTNVNLAECSTRHNMYYPELGGVGIQSSYMPVTNLAACYMYLFLFDGTNVTTYAVMYNHLTGTLWVYEEPANWVQVADIGSQREGVNCFFTWKLVGDAATGEYERLLFNGELYDLTGRTADVIPDGTTISMTAEFTTLVSGNNTIEPVIDRIIVTQNEPIGG